MCHKVFPQIPHNMFLFCSYPIIGIEKSQSGRFVLLQLWLQLWPQLRRESSTIIAKRSFVGGASQTNIPGSALIVASFSDPWIVRPKSKSIRK